MQDAFDQVRGYVEYLRDLGVYEFYRSGEPVSPELQALVRSLSAARAEEAPVTRAVAQSLPQTQTRPAAAPPPSAAVPGMRVNEVQERTGQNEVQERTGESEIPKPIAFDQLAPLPEVRLRPEAKAAGLARIREHLGDCTRCPLAYAGRQTIVYGDGDPNASLLFVGEGPGADEDVSGMPFVGKAGQLLTNMIQAMGLTREQVYIANIVKCRPPKNRVPEPVEASTCSQFLLEQMDVIQPKVIVALGATAATYLLGVKQSLTSLRGQWHSCRGAKVAVTFHPAFLLRDPRQKGEAWKDLQRVMVELGLAPRTKS